LAIKLLPAEQIRLANAPTVNPEAYDAYLKSSQYWIKLTPADLDTAERYCNLALQKDPSFAPAHAGISLVWACRQQMGYAPPSEAGPKAKAAALKAIELDDTVSDAHYALAAVQTWTDWDFAAAEREWQRAVELNPGNSDALAMYSHFLMIMGRPEEAMAQIERALKRDPFNVIIQSFYAIDLLFVRRYDDAIAAAREALRVQPGAPLGHEVLWFAYSSKGMPREALEGAKGYLTNTYGDRAIEDVLDQGYAQGGYTEGMRRAAQALAVRFRVAFALPTDIAFLYIEARENGQALDWFEKAFEVRDPGIPYLGSMPNLDSLHAQPRFQDLLRRMKLPAPK
jgi:tetratricopeptide (TPR) repeat protein